MHKDVPVSMPRTSVTSHRQQQPLNSLTKTKVLENCKTLGPSETQKASSAKSPGGPKTPSPTERHTKQDTLQGTSGVSKSLETHRVAGDQRSLKSSQPTVQQSLSTSSKSSTEGRLAGNSKTLETKASSDITEDQSQPSSTEVAKSSTKQSVVPAAQMSSPGHLEVSKTRANKTSPVTSKAQTNQNSPEPSLSTSNQNLSKNDRVYNQSVPENSKIPSNQNLSKAYKTLSNQNLSEVNTSLSDQNISETSRTVSDQQPTEDSEVSKSLNQNPPEGPKTQSNQSLSETLRIQSNPNLSDTLKTPLNHSHPEASTTLSNQSLTEASRTSLDHSHPEVCRTSSNQSLPHNTKAPASRQGSNSSLMTTFGTPVVTSAQNSFLHSSSTRTMYDDTYSTPSSLHTPETTDFLKEIKSQPEIPALTAGIQKSALYASTSCLKGLPGAKPVITPKPPKLKDKPKVPFKPSTNSSRIYATPSPINPKVPIGNLSGAVSAPNLASMSVEDRSDTASTTSGTSEASSNSRPDGHPETMYKVTPEQKKPPPTTQAPAIPTFSGRLQTEVVYDVPVTLASSVSSMPKTDSPENLSREQKRDDATIYHEIDDSIRANRLSAVPDQDHDSPCVSSGTLSEPGYSTASVSHQESTRCQSRSAFEANRSMLSAALDFGTKATRSSSSKRPAPRPPAEGQEDDDVEEAPESVELEVSQPSPVVEGSPKEPLQQERPQEAPSVAPDASNDGESYSSFTDDFDDDDEEEEAAQPTLRKAERSSSAVPFYRNSICPIVTHEVKGTDNSTPSTEAMVSTCPGGNGVSQEVNLSSAGISGLLPSKPQASRSHSVPRVADHIVNIDPSGSRGGPDIPTSSSSSKFSFGRSGFFRPSSPPTAKRDFDTSSSERGRDRSSKKTSASRFSLKKLLRLGSAGKDEEKKAAKEQEKRLARESKRNKLTIIHPLDYNQTGVEVIARPEKTSPIYDYTGIYGYIPPPQLSSKLEDLSTPMTQMTMVQASPALSLASKRSDASAEASHSPSTAAFTTPLPSGVTDVLPTSLGSTSSVTAISTASPSASPIATISTTCPSTSTSGCSSTTGIHSSSPVMAPVATSFGSTTNSTEKRGSYTRRDSGVERRESGNSHSSSGTASVASSSHHQHNLGYNSEGRPKPPPPPRKVSLESGQTCDIYSSLADLHTPVSSHYSTPTPIDTPSRPQRPPPPIRTPSNAGTKSGPPRPDPPKLGKDSVYANLGDVRAPIMPRKPGRTASIRGEDDREKRRAPQPPQYLQAGQEVTQQTALRASRHQHEDSTSSSCSGISNSRAAKGPAPARPRQPHHTSNEYEAFGHDDATAFLQCGSELQSPSSVLYDAPLPLEMRPRSPQDVHTPDGYIIPAQLRLSTVTEGTTSTPSSRQEKTGRLSVRRGSAVTHRSLEDQYGAVMSANLEALSNMLDKLSNSCCPAGYEEVISGVTRWKDVIIDDDVIEGAGHRLFYAGVACGRDVTLMLTPEIKVDAHHLLTPLPIATFKDELPSHLLSHKYITRGKSTLGTVWVLPPLSLTTLRALAEEECLFSSAVPVEWERKACLLLLQLVTGLKQMQAQGVEETCIDLTLIAQGSQVKEQDSNPRLILIPPTETGTSLMSLCQCAAAATLLLMGVDEPVERAQEGNFTIPDMVPSPHAFNILLQLLHQEKAGSLTQVKCVLEVLLFGPDSTENDAKEGEEVEAALQRWLDLERATVLHSLIRGPLESSVLTKFHLLFLVRTNSRVLRETMKLLGDPEVTTF
ncbi:uncharacterized protein [Panulirus ornatus]|uniref:uncharacterized protein isoform X2 n=1 Tax=Panulirus ornatus TaxID=150431 RepID=UPI003A8B2F82